MSAERDLIRRAALGEHDALSELADVWRPRARRTAFALLGDADAAEDVAQEVMIRLHASLAGFRRESDLGTWLHRITINVCYDHLRATRRRREDGPPRESSSAPATDPHEQVDAQRARNALQTALGSGV